MDFPVEFDEDSTWDNPVRELTMAIHKLTGTTQALYSMQAKYQHPIFHNIIPG